MQRFSFIALFIVFVFPALAFGMDDGGYVSRRDGFLTIWQGISRPAMPAKTRFTDVPESAPGSLEIDYAASRGIIDDEEAKFYPEDNLRALDALVWMLRTRNVDDPDAIMPATLTGFLLRYPVMSMPDERATITFDALQQSLRTLDDMLRREDHEASLYAEKFHGKGTAFGEAFDMNALTAAHRTFPHNTLVKVTNIENGKSVVVRINDRGPYVEGRDMDLSLAAFTSIAERSKGVIRATFERLGDASIVGGCGNTAQMQRRVGGGVALDNGVPTFLSLGQSMSIKAKRSFVVRGIIYPDGNMLSSQDFVHPGEEYSFKPSMEGAYRIILSGIRSRKRTMKMEVMKCDVSQE